MGFVGISQVQGGEIGLEIHKLSVLPMFRHKGLGEQLLNFCKEKAKEMNLPKLKLDIVDENELLKNWYLKNGFRYLFSKKLDFLPFTIGYMEWSAE